MGPRNEAGILARGESVLLPCGVRCEEPSPLRGV